MKRSFRSLWAAKIGAAARGVRRERRKLGRAIDGVKVHGKVRYFVDT